MFGDKKKANNANINKTTLISLGTEVTGDIKFNGNIELEGVVCGSISSTDAQSSFRVLNSGRLEGELHVPRALVDGCIKGDVHVTEHLELTKNALIEGDVYYTVLETVKGARINGRLLFVEEKKPVAPPRPMGVPNALDAAGTAPGVQTK
ncbi:MAG: polymer-forming cytoskeletal protein [Pseudomonadota bacterium]